LLKRSPERDALAYDLILLAQGYPGVTGYSGITSVLHCFGLGVWGKRATLGTTGYSINKAQLRGTLPQSSVGLVLP